MRPLSPNESIIANFLASLAGLAFSFDSIQVTPLNDGGMGSFRFGAQDDRAFGSMASECHFLDSDSVPVLVALNLDQKGNPLEVDIWKTDFSPLQHWPSIPELISGQPNQSFNPDAASASHRLILPRRSGSAG